MKFLRRRKPVPVQELRAYHGEYCRDPNHEHLDEFRRPMHCEDCGRGIYYDYTLERYRHLTVPFQGCFLIPREDDDGA